jgi:hypothetical protein
MEWRREGIQKSLIIHADEAVFITSLKASSDICVDGLVLGAVKKEVPRRLSIFNGVWGSLRRAITSPLGMCLQNSPYDVVSYGILSRPFSM